MNDPFRKSSRKYIPLDIYQKLFEKIGHKSLLDKDLNIVSESEIKSRINELDQCEQQEGFVFVGEKSWLETLLAGQTRYPYEKWVEHVFRQYLGLSFTFGNYGPFPDMPGKSWKVRLEKPGQYLPGHDELINPAIESVLEITHVDIHVFGTEKEISLKHLAKAFEFLFDLEYMIASLPQKTGEGGPVAVEGLNVMHPEDPNKWELDVLSGYGAEFDYWFENRRPV